MRIEAADYVNAARERLRNANILYDAAEYSFALYAAGVAVEALLRAYIFRLEPKLETGHNLKLLLSASNIDNLATPAESQRIITAIITLYQRWSNNLRYSSNDRLRRHLKKDKLDRGIRGDFLKENCRIAIEAATTIISIGVTKWKK